MTHTIGILSFLELHLHMKIYNVSNVTRDAARIPSFKVKSIAIFLNFSTKIPDRQSAALGMGFAFIYDNL